MVRPSFPFQVALDADVGNSSKEHTPNPPFAQSAIEQTTERSNQTDACHLSMPSRNLDEGLVDQASQHKAMPLHARNAAAGGLDLSGDGYLRLADVLRVYPVSRAAWYDGVNKCLYPPSVPLGKRAVGWTRESIRRLIANPPKF